MAFNGYFPQYYQPMNYSQSPQNYQQVPQNQQIQNGGFIPVPSEEVARNYPVAPGNSVTFKNENAPYVYTKTMGFSQLDRPIFEKYKLVREEDAPNDNNLGQIREKREEIENESINEFKKEIEGINDEIRALKERMDKLEDVGA